MKYLKPYSYYIKENTSHPPDMEYIKDIFLELKDGGYNITFSKSRSLKNDSISESVLIKKHPHGFFHIGSKDTFFKLSDIKDELLHLRRYIDSNKKSKEIKSLDKALGSKNVTGLRHGAPRFSGIHRDDVDQFSCDVLYPNGDVLEFDDFNSLGDDVEILSIVVYFNL